MDDVKAIHCQFNYNNNNDNDLKEIDKLIEDCVKNCMLLTDVVEIITNKGLRKGQEDDLHIKACYVEKCSSQFIEEIELQCLF